MIQGNVVITCYQTLIANHKRSQACGIDLGDSYVVTGGEFSRRTVARYSLTGTLTYLADLQEDRYRHACSSFLDSNGVTVSSLFRKKNFWLLFLFQNYLVTGGYGSYYLSSTEIYVQSTWSYVASLPSHRASLSAANVGNTVFVFGMFRKPLRYL